MAERITVAKLENEVAFLRNQLEQEKLSHNALQAEVNFILPYILNFSSTVSLSLLAQRLF